MHILILPSEVFMTDNSPLGGIFQFQQAKALLSKGYQVGIIGVNFLSAKALLKNNNYARFELMNEIPIYRKYVKSILPVRFTGLEYRVNKLIAEFKPVFEEYIRQYGKPDIVHAHNFLFASFIAQHIKKEYKIPFVITEHSSVFSIGNIHSKLDKHIIQCAEDANAITAVSSDLKKILANRLSITIEVLPNIVDNFFYYKEKSDNIRYKYLNIARHDENKNQKLLITAFTEKFKDYPDVFLRIAGYGVLEKELKELVKAYNMENRIHFLGRLSQEKVREEMQNSDCFVLSSNYETFGVVLIESLACGTPVIATKCGGPEDIVDDKNGILINVGEKNSLKDAMQKMYEHKKEYNRKEISEITIGKFGEEAFVKRATVLYGRALAGGH